jgi:diguanylate cyclase (GGDEF)-like protein
MAGQMEYSYFPVRLHDLRSRIHYTELEEGFFRLGEVLVEVQYLNHTAPTISYRITSNGATVAYVTDHEPFGSLTGRVFPHPGDQRHIAFLKGADLIIHDAQYSGEEYRTKIGWGHSPIEYATDIAMVAEVSRLALFHHDPGHDDATLEGLEKDARARVAAAGGGLDVFAAAEGLELNLKGRGLVPTVAELSALRRRSIAGGRVLVVSSNEDEIADITKVLTGDFLVLLPTSDMRTALARASVFSPDLAIIDGRLPDGEGATLIPALRALLNRDLFPVILLTRHQESSGHLQINDLSCIDLLTKPFSPPMLRARVRAWLGRTLMVEGVSPVGHRVREAQAVPARDAPPSAESAGRPLPKVNYAEILSTMPLFKPLSREQLEKLVDRAIERLYPAGHVVVHQGEPSDSIFVVLTGRVRIIVAAPDLPLGERFLAEAGEGELIGELGVLRDKPRSATVETVEKTRCLQLPQEDFLEALRKSTGLARVLLKRLSDRINEADHMTVRYAPDPLTGLGSRRAFHDQYRRLAAVARRRKCGIVVLVLDILHLRAINDQFGYTIGDEVLRAVADVLMDSVRATDLLARYGGDEFVLLMVDAGSVDVEHLVSRLQAKLGEMGPRRGLPAPVQFTTGAAISQDPPETADDLVRIAEQEIYQKKSQVHPHPL